MHCNVIIPQTYKDLGTLGARMIQDIAAAPWRFAAAQGSAWSTFWKKPSMIQGLWPRTSSRSKLILAPDCLPQTLAVQSDADLKKADASSSLRKADPTTNIQPSPPDVRCKYISFFPKFVKWPVSQQIFNSNNLSLLSVQSQDTSTPHFADTSPVNKDHFYIRYHSFISHHNP